MYVHPEVPTGIPVQAFMTPPPPCDAYKRGGFWVGALTLGGWVPPTPLDHPPLINHDCTTL